VIRVAATGDIHFGVDSAGTLRPHLADLPEKADVLLIAGDLTRCGSSQEGAVLAAEIEGLGLPTVTVLGNHDYEAEQESQIIGQLQDAGVHVLDNANHVVDAAGASIGITGVKGFGGGFAGACGSDFGEREMKAFIRHTKEVAAQLSSLLTQLDTDVRIALLHYSPVEETLRGERLEIYPFLGSYLLAEAVDGAGADLVLHGHAHNGVEKGITPGGITVRNVAQSVIKHAYNIYVIDDSGKRSAGDEVLEAV
jgi:Icc-related predicted phosphoesterase